MNLEEHTIEKAACLMQKGELTSEELLNECVERIEKENGEINAFVEVFKDASEKAKKIDSLRNNGESLSKLAGIPVAIKDNILMRDKSATAASAILEGYKAPYNSTVIDKLQEAGAVIIGRTNMDEFAMGSSTEKSVYGPVKNPVDKERVPGGSSGGSAAAVSMGGALAALGSDTGGSIRQPASFCGVVGLKPTYGSVSRHGLIAMGSSLDVIGPFANSVADTEVVFNAIKGKDEMDST